ncbi:MAG: hypothetical protein EOP56_19275 [Sphingobacteriales bacterium]|nr:MAG: hypothetical protein EOP56_19275 [Sphingobacteriales bacterium]
MEKFIIITETSGDGQVWGRITYKDALLTATADNIDELQEQLADQLEEFYDVPADQIEFDIEEQPGT